MVIMVEYGWRGEGDAYLRSWEEPPSLKPNVTEMSRLRWKTNHLEGERKRWKLYQTEIIRLETTGWLIKVSKERSCCCTKIQQDNKIIKEDKRYMAQFIKV